MRRVLAGVTVLVVAAAFACAPRLTPPHESIRLSGTVEDAEPPPPPVAAPSPNAGKDVTTPTPKLGASKPAPLQTYPVLTHMPLGVAVYEACTPMLYVLKKCPGRFLGEAKLVKPGPFVVELDTESPEIVVFAFRGFLGPEQQQEACAEAKIPIQEASKPIALKLQSGSCSIKLERRYG